MRIVTLLGLILQVRNVNGNASLLLFWGRIDLIDRFLRHIHALQLQYMQNGRRKSSLSMIYVADGTDVDMGFCPFKFSCHRFSFLLLAYSF